MRWVIALLTTVFALTLIALGMSLEDGARQNAALEEATWQLRRVTKERNDMEESRRLLQAELADRLTAMERERLARIEKLIPSPAPVQPEQTVQPALPVETPKAAAPMRTAAPLPPFTPVCVE